MNGLKNKVMKNSLKPGDLNSSPDSETLSDNTLIKIRHNNVKNKMQNFYFR